MSKSLGNALDPLDLISEYGADALRFTLLTGGQHLATMPSSRCSAWKAAATSPTRSGTPPAS